MSDPLFQDPVEIQVEELQVYKPGGGHPINENGDIYFTVDPGSVALVKIFGNCDGTEWCLEHETVKNTKCHDGLRDNFIFCGCQPCIGNGTHMTVIPFPGNYIFSTTDLKGMPNKIEIHRLPYDSIYVQMFMSCCQQQ